MLKDILRLSNGDEINFEVEDRFVDTGEVLIHFNDGMDFYTESFVIEDLKQFRNRINEVINKCKEIEQNNDDFTLEELKTMRGLMSIKKYKDYTNPIYKSIISKLNNKIGKGE